MRYLKFGLKGVTAFVFGLLLGFVLTFGVPVHAGDGMVTFSTGQKLPAASLNLIVTAFRTGRFYDSAGAGSNYLGVSHNGTDAVLTTNTGKVRISSPTGSTVDLEVNGTDVLAIGSAGITASQYIAGASNMGLTGSLEVDGTSKLDGVLNVAGTGTFAGLVSAANVAVGSTTSDQLLYVKKAASGRAWSSNVIDLVNIENNTNAALNIITTDSTSGYLMFSDASTRNQAHIRYDHSTDTYTIWGGGATQATFSSTTLNLQDNALTTTGAVTAAGTTPTALNYGVQLSTSANHNSILDSYNEASYTPTYQGSSSAGAGTYSVQVGGYTRVGNQVTFHYYITTTAHTGTGNMELVLPVSAATTTNFFQTCPAPDFVNLTIPAASVLGALIINPSTPTVATLRSCPNTGGGSCAALAIDTAALIVGSCTYRTNTL